MRGKQVRSKRAGLKRREPRRSTHEGNVRSGLALKHLANKNQFTALIAVTDAVADHAFAQRGGEFRRKVADLIGVGKKDEIGLRRFNDLLESNAETVRSVGFEQIMFNAQNFSHIFRSEFIREGRNILADD